MRLQSCSCVSGIKCLVRVLAVVEEDVDFVARASNLKLHVAEICGYNDGRSRRVPNIPIRDMRQDLGTDHHVSHDV